MASNPLYPPADDNPPASQPPDSQVAADLIRQKVARLYDQEPVARQELSEAEAVTTRSKHQDFIYQLNNSGKDLATIQIEWHDYYQALPDLEKHQVWQEFYDSQALLTKGAAQPAAADPQQLAKHKHQVVTSDHSPATPPARKLRDARSASAVQAAIRHNVAERPKLQAKHHFQSLLFGLGMGSLVVIVFLFSFFNEVFIAPFIQPSRVAAATPLIVSTGSVAPTATPEVIIPKINVEIPVNYSETSTNEADIENDLQDGVVHYPTTSLPGQDGNTAFFGHSSNNIFNKGRYKFAFVLLHTLVNGDTFYLTYNDKVYVYKVISHTIVSPNDVGVLGPVAGQTATATLITCDPPGTSINRLIVVGQQISPDPNTNAAAPASASSSTTPTVLPNDGPTLWSRVMATIAGKTVSIIIILVALGLVVRWVRRPLRGQRQSAKLSG